MIGVLVLGLALGTNPYLDEARTLFDAVHFREAEEKLALARQVKDSTITERRALFDLLARARLAQGKGDGALAAYAELLTEDPHAPPPALAAPKVVELFTRAKERLYPKGYARLVRLPAPPDRLELDLVDPWAQISDVRLSTGAPVKRDGLHVSAALPETGTWRAEALSATGDVLTSIEGNRAALEPVAVAPAPAPAVAETTASRSTAPAWIATALALAGVAVSGGFAASAVTTYSGAGDMLFGDQTHAGDLLARDRAAVAWGTGAAALALVVTAVALWIWAR